jgi:two-component system, NarL family, response regulator NreC
MHPHLRLARSTTAAHAPQAPRRIQVVLADDHAIVRRTMRRLLDDEDDIAVRAEAENLPMLVGQIHRHAPQVVVLDLRLPNGSMLETIRRLRAQAPRTEIVVLTMEESAAFAREAIHAGAVGFVLKDRADSDLVTAVRLAARGEEFVTPRVARALEAQGTPQMGAS